MSLKQQSQNCDAQVPNCPVREDEEQGSSQGTCLEDGREQCSVLHGSAWGVYVS